MSMVIVNVLSLAFVIVIKFVSDLLPICGFHLILNHYL